MNFWRYLKLDNIEELSPIKQVSNDIEFKPLKRTAFEVRTMRQAFLTMDQAFDYVGDNSSYQKIITLILSFQWLFYAFFVMGMPVLFENPLFYCSIQNTSKNDSISQYSSALCTEQQACNSDQPFEVMGYNSITKEFQLYCGKKYWLGLIASLFFIGQSVGGIVFPVLANAYGRKRVIIFGALVGANSIIICGFCNNIYLLMVFFFTAGFGLSGYETVVYVYITEISASRFRSISTNVLATVWAASMIFFSLWLELLRSWRILMVLGIGLPLVLGAISIFYFFVESPRWLNSRGRYDECRQVLRLVSVYNQRKPFDFNFNEEMDRFSSQAFTLKSHDNHTSQILYQIPLFKQTKGSSYFDLFRHRKLRNITGILMISWFLRYFTYYGIQFSIQTFGYSIKSTLIFVSVAEVLAAVISAFIKLRISRISSLRICLISITVCCLFFFFVRVPQSCMIDDQVCHVKKGFTIGMAFILKFFTTFYMTTLNTYTGEVYPTTVRTNGYGVCMTVGQMGSSLVPIYVQYMIQNEIAVNPLTNISLISTLVYFLTKYLPETFNKTICEDIHDEYLNSAFVSLQQKHEQEMQDVNGSNKQNLSNLWILEQKKINQSDLQE